MNRSLFVPLLAGLLLLVGCPASTPICDGPASACGAGGAEDCRADGDGCLSNAACCSGYCNGSDACAPACEVTLAADPIAIEADGARSMTLTVASGTTPVTLEATRGTFPDGSTIVTLASLPASVQLLACDSRVEGACAGSAVVTATPAGCAAATLTLYFWGMGACTDGLVCYQGRSETLDVGLCSPGATTCTDGIAACVGQVLPAIELCDGLDNDCDGTTDDLPNGQACYEGAPDTVDPVTGLPFGACRGGVQACTGGMWQGCVDQVLPTSEDCGAEGLGNGLDEDCDGVVDDGCGCVEGSSRPCYTGPTGTDGVGRCGAGAQLCSAGNWGRCEGQLLPVPEVCENGMDDDCSGVADDPAVCNLCPSVALLCYSGPFDTLGIGVCRSGTRACAQGVMGDCDGEIVPSPELCDGRDNDCDGAADDGWPWCDGGLACVNGHCVPVSCGPEAPSCPTGYTCAGGACAPVACGTGGPCAPGLVCARGECLDPCDGIQCGLGTVCAGGVCTGGLCYEEGCPGGMLCKRALCVADACLGVTCPSGSFCRDGGCFPACANVTCAEGERCTLDGTCEPDACLTVSCGAGNVCRDGTCAADPCTRISCGRGLVCEDGGCVDDPCAGITCPIGTCDRGQCVSAGPG